MHRTKLNLFHCARINPNMERQLLLFIVGCVTVRIALAIAVPFAPKRVLRFLVGPLLLVAAIGFATIYVTGMRKTGAETFGKAIWWDHMRPVHAALYFMASLLALKGSRTAGLPLGLDVALGVAASALHYSNA